MDQSKLILCPYCGHTQSASSDRCEVCRGLFEPLSRRATQIAMGPWFIRDANNPFRPGCSYEVLLRQIEQGRIKPTTVLRGPTTRQFWSVARNVPGVAHLLGYCHECGRHVKPEDKSCPTCAASFKPVPQRNELGLQYETAAQAAAAQRELEALQEELAPRAGRDADSARLRPEPMEKSPATSDTGTDLLDEVLGSVKPTAGKAATAKPRTGAAKLLEIKSPAAAPPTPATPAHPETLDFAPSAETAPVVVAAPRSKLFTWLLILLNVLVLVMIGLLIWSQSHTDASARSTPVREVAPSITASPDEPSVTSPDAITPAPPSIFSEVETTPTAGSETPPPSRSLLAISDAMAEARKLEEQGKLRDALDLLQKLADSMDARDRPLGLDSHIRSLEDRLAHRNTAHFFGIPTE